MRKFIFCFAVLLFTAGLLPAQTYRLALFDLAGSLQSAAFRIQWNIFTEEAKGKYPHVEIVEYECGRDEGGECAREPELNRFPAVYLYDLKTETKVIFKGERTSDALHQFVKEHAPAPVTADVEGGGTPYELIYYRAEGVEDCDLFAPDWKLFLADAGARFPDLEIKEYDCTNTDQFHLCDAERDLHGYPSVFLYDRATGAKHEYHGTYKVASLNTWVEMKMSR